MASANLLLLRTKSHRVRRVWWFEVTAFLRCSGETHNTCHNISCVGLFVVHPTVPLSARGFPAHQQPAERFSSYTRPGNLTSCNGSTRRWYLVTPANCTATCCAARSKYFCYSPPFFWASACPFSPEYKWVRRREASALATCPPFARERVDAHTAWGEEHEPWPRCVWIERPWSSAGELTPSVRSSGGIQLIKQTAMP